MGKKIANKNLLHKKCRILFDKKENRYRISVGCALKQKYRNDNRKEYDNIITETILDILPARCHSKIKIHYID